MKRTPLIFLALSLLWLPVTVWAQDDVFDEDDLFSDAGSLVTESTENSSGEILAKEISGRSLSFSGEVRGQFDYAVTRDATDNLYAGGMESDLLLDLRAGNGIKAFGNWWVRYSPQALDSGSNNSAGNETDNLIKEFFGDLNLAHKVYFKMGKQNLKWGRGYFWNPTDAITEDRKDFTDIDARREGVYGLKMHVPFGTSWNVYGFVNTANAETVDEFAMAGKLEFIVFDDIEFALSGWTKKGYISVYGFDMATHKFETDLWAELSLSYGDNRTRLEVIETEDGKDYVDVEVTDEWVPQICAGFKRYFGFGNFRNRISLVGEFYYNESGYEENMLDNEETRKHFLEGSYFEPSSYGKYYAAIFSTFGRFLTSKMTLRLNLLGNLSDASAMLTSGLDYQINSNAAVQFELNAYLGAEKREYTLEGNALSTSLKLRLGF